MEPRSPQRSIAAAPLWAALLALIAGIVAADQAAGAHAAAIALGIAAAAGIAAAVLFGRRGMAATLAAGLVCVAFGGVGFALMATDKEALAADWGEGERVWRAVAVSAPKPAGSSFSIDLRTTDRRGREQTVRARMMPDAAAALLPGDSLLFLGEITAPHGSGNPGAFDFGAYLRRCGIGGTTFCAEGHWKKTQRVGRALPLRFLRYRQRLVEKYREKFEGREFAVMAALTLGDKNYLDSTTKDLFAQVGSSHILALSGLHLGILFFLYNLLLSRLRGRRWAHVVGSLCGIGLVWAFALLTGMSFSLVRAATMFSVAQLAVCLQRSAFSLNNLALAAFVILLFSPQALFDVGFQLSCTSVLALLLGMPLFPRPKWLLRRRVLLWIYGLCAVGLCAQIGTAPLVAYYFHRLPTFGIVANFVVVPIAYPLLFGGLAFFLLPFLRGPLAAVLAWLLRLMFRALEWLAALPHATVDVYPTLTEVALAYVAIALIYAWLARRKAWLLYVGIAAAVMLGAERLVRARLAKPLPRMIVFYQNFQGPLVQFVESAERSFLWAPDSAAAAKGIDYIEKTFWNPKNMRTPQRVERIEPDSAAAYARAYNNNASVGITCAPNGFSFGGRRVGVLDERAKGRPAVPLDVDYLFIARGFKGHIADALDRFLPNKIVLDAHLTDFYRRRFKAEADSIGLPLHDLNREGALIDTLAAADAKP